MKNNLGLCWLGFMVFWSGTIAAAEPRGERLKVDAGFYFISSSSSTLSYVSPSSVGVTIDSERDLDWETSLTTFRLNVLYRFDESSSLDFAYYAFGRDGDVILDEELTWGDDVYPVNANLKSSMDQDIFKFSYLWSFHRDEKVELGLSAGLHVTRLSVNLDGTFNGSPVASESTSVTAPLPVVGFVLNYHINPALTWSNKIEVFYLDIGDTKGSFSDIKSGLEYRFNDSWGCGLAIISSRLKVEDENADKTLYLDDHQLGLNGYLTYRY